MSETFSTKNNTKKYHYCFGTKPVYDETDDLGRFLGSHICLLLDNDIFEYGYENKNGLRTYERKINVGKSPDYDWHELNNMKGETDVSPEELHKIIMKDIKNWEGKYDTFYHNCHDFIDFCLEKIGSSYRIRH